MSSYKVYKTSDSFEPEDLLSSVPKKEAEFESSIIKERIEEGQFLDTRRRRQSIPTPSTETAPGNKQQGSTKNNRGDEFYEPFFNPEIPAEDSPPLDSDSAVPEDHRTVSQEQIEQEEPEIKPPPTPAPPVKEDPPSSPPGIPEEEVEQLLQESYEKGVQQGIQDGLKLAEEDYATATQAMLQSCSQLDNLRETILRNSSAEIQNLVLAIAEKIIRHSVKEQQDTILKTVDYAIQQAVKSDEFTVYLNPADYDIIREKSEQLITGASGLKNLVVKTDDKIQQGGCRLESDSCLVDATIVSQLEIISDQLKSQI